MKHKHLRVSKSQRRSSVFPFVCMLLAASLAAMLAAGGLDARTRKGDKAMKDAHDAEARKQWDRALEFVDAWAGFAPGDLIALSGGRDGVQLSDQQGLDDVRRRMRLLLGLPEFRAEDGVGFSHSVATEARW